MEGKKTFAGCNIQDDKNTLICNTKMSEDKGSYESIRKNVLKVVRYIVLLMLLMEILRNKCKFVIATILLLIPGIKLQLILIRIVSLIPQGRLYSVEIKNMTLIPKKMLLIFKIIFQFSIQSK